jgi:hypothetical protein
MEITAGWLLGRVQNVAKNRLTGNTNKEPKVPVSMAGQFANLIIRSVIACYAVWGTTVIVDLAACEARRPGECNSQRAELRGAATTIPATLLAWLADSPVSSAGAIAQKLTARKPRQASEADQ